ncbi:OmpA/MotB family protein [Aquifex aeolicus]|uniref:Flagellar motor protein MotB-like n=1 Tax=Aquifex aeolicus (strain VF5) TaxID=224324 RepID=O67120_AQUAE|nr:flagellar motor protein MotB [Aquifex aeolicus]AAC07085.1 flagellar motor protein MotB-like [Aquifex aeolicus VF5]
MAYKKKEECPKPPAWLTSFSDLMSLLLTFFILLYAMSTLEIPALEKFLSYFRKNPELYPPKNSVVPPITHPKDYAVKIKKRISKVLPPWAYQVVVAEEYIKLRLFDRIFFENGDYKLTEKGRKTLEEIAPLLIALSDEISSIRVEGHVGPTVEIKNPIIRNKWELAGRRATEVIRYLENRGVPHDKLVAVSYGDKRPLYRWRQSVLIERNNRVEINIYVKREKK